MAYPIGYAVTAIMTMTAGAHSSQPSLRSARAPSDNFFRRRPLAAGSWAVTGGVVVVMCPPLCAYAARSRSDPLARQRVVDLRPHALLGTHRVDRARR